MTRDGESAAHENELRDLLESLYNMQCLRGLHEEEERLA